MSYNEYDRYSEEMNRVAESQKRDVRLVGDVCPFCGYARSSTVMKRQKDTFINCIKHHYYTAYVTCNRCHCRGPVVSIQVPVTEPYRNLAIHKENLMREAERLFKQRSN